MSERSSPKTAADGLIAHYTLLILNDIEKITMLHSYSSNTNDCNNRLMNFIEYHHPCPCCGSDVETYDCYDEMQCCEQCEEVLREYLDYTQWLESEFEHDPQLWFRFSDLFIQCYTILLYINSVA